MDKTARLDLKVIERQAFVSPYLRQRLRSLEEVLVKRQQRTAASEPAHAVEAAAAGWGPVDSAGQEDDPKGHGAGGRNKPA